MDFLTSSLFVVSIVWICILIRAQARKSPKLPPGPYGLPIIGSILRLGSKPHHSLARLAREYGPVISLRLGSMTTVVISSPEVARIVLQKHDSSFSSRAIPSAIEHVGHGEFSMAWVATTERRWRKLRKISKEQMLLASRLDGSEGLRQEKLRKLRDYITGRAGGRAVDVGEAAFATALNLMSASLFSMEFAAWGSESSQEMKELVCGVMESIGSPNLADYFPVLKYADPQGILKKTKFYFDKFFQVFDGIIDERLKTRGEKQDLLETLIDLNQRDEAEFSRDELKHLLVDLFVAGTDTSSGTVEWAMTELMRSPTKMAILKTELRNLIQEKGQIQESDIPKLPYLLAVVKETFRLHPAAPFLVPRKAISDVKINGYMIPKNAQVLINVWASGRDPNNWENAHEFLPERFLNENSHVDFKGKNFELLPFGGGRRICPGLPLANRMVHLMLATFVGYFDWELEAMEPQEIDMEERFGLTLQKALSLEAIPNPNLILGPSRS